MPDIAQAGLFPVTEAMWSEPPLPACDVTAGERRRQRQAEAIAGGYHPLAATLGLRLRLHTDRSLTCGACRYRVLERGHSRTYPKCRYPDPDSPPWDRTTNGPATDVLASWPACVDWQPREATP